MNIGMIFMKICSMSLTASYCIAVVILLRLLLCRQPKVLSYLLWSVVLFRLLCPVSITGAYSLVRSEVSQFSWESSAAASEDGAAWRREEAERRTGNRESGGGQTADISDREAPYAAERDGNVGLKRLFVIGGWIWLTGMTALAAHSLSAAVRLRRSLRGASDRPLYAEDGTAVYEAAGLGTPLVFGILRPRIYLPAGTQGRERRFVLAHECVHIARRDYLWKLLAWGAVCLHWFNPLVWLAYRLAEADMEMSCDEAALARLGREVRKEYAEVLLSFSCADGSRNGGPIAFGENMVKGRIRHLLHYKKRTAIAVTAVSLFACAVIAGLAVNPRRRDDAAAGQESFVEAYAEAFCARDGNALVKLYTDETAAYANIVELDRTEGGYTFGFSSPWPDEYRFLIGESSDVKDREAADGQDTAQAEIWYYAWTSDPHIAVWKERLTLQETAEGWRAADSELTWLDSIATAEQFREAYCDPDSGGYRFANYVERRFVEAINEQTAYDAEAGGVDRNAVYREPQTAVPWILNLTGGESTLTQRSSDGEAVVVYTFADGSQVSIPAYDANFDGATETYAREGNWAYERQENPETDETDDDAGGRAGDAAVQNESFANREVWVVPTFWQGY